MSGFGDLLQQIIGGARAAQRDPRLPSMPVPLVGLDLAAPFNALPAPLRQVASTMPMGALLTNPLADMAANAGRRALIDTQRATTGQVLANLGRVLENPVAHAALGTPTGRAAVSTLPVAGALARMLMIPGLLEAAQQARQSQATTAGGNPWQRALAANEAGARGNEGTVGFLNAAYDPTNALPLAGELAKVNQLGRLAKVLEGVNTMQGVANVPLMGAGETTSAALRRLRNRVNMLQMGREAAQGLGPVFDVAQAEAGVRQLARGRQFVDEGGLGGPQQIGHLPTLPDSAFDTSVGGRYGNGPGRPGPALPPELGPGLPPEYGPALPTRGNVPPSWGPIGPALPPEGAPLDIPQGPPRRRGVPVPETQLPIGPNLPPVVGPPRPGRRGIPETVLPTPVAPTAYGRETFSLGNPLQLQETAQRLGIQQRPPQTVEDLRAAFAGLQTPAPAVPPVSEAVSAPAVPSTVADLGGNVSREAVIQATANRPPNALTPTLRSLHNAVYPGGQADFAIPALTGVGVRDFRTSLLTDHPTGNVAEQYLDYLVSRVQGDKRAAARLGAADPGLLADVLALPPHPTPVNEQKVALQQRLGAGKFKAGATPDVAPATPDVAGDPQAAFDAILASGDSGRMSGELPTGTAFWERRLGVGPDEARALLDGAVADGRLGVGPDGALRFKPRALANPAHDITSPTPLSNVDIAPEATPRPSTVEPLPPPAAPPGQPSAGELLRRYRERWPEGTPVAPEAVPTVDTTTQGAGNIPAYLTSDLQREGADIIGRTHGGVDYATALAEGGDRIAASKVPSIAGKAPWQLTRKEWNDATAELAHNTFDTSNTRSGAGETMQYVTGKAWLKYDVPELVDREYGARRVTHRDVVLKAIDEGKPVPPEVLADYPDLRPTPVTPTQARDELFADAADAGVADVAQGGAAPKGVKGTVSIEVHEGPRGTTVKREVPGTIYGDLAITPSLSNPKRYNVTEIPTGTTLNTGKPLALKEAQAQIAEYLGIGRELNLSTQTRDGLTAIGLVRSARRIGRELTPFEQSFIERAKNPTPGGDIAAGGGGGGGLGIASLPGGLAGAWRMGSTALGAGLGGTLGAGAGFATADGDLKDRLDKAAQAGTAGAILGGAAGLGLSRNTTGEAADNILRHAWDQAGKGQAEAVAARQTSGLIPRLRDIYPALKRARIQHPKNAFNDEAFGSVVTAGLQPRAWENLAKNREDVSRRLATAKTDEDLLPTPTQDRRAAMGLAGTKVDLGASLAQAEKQAGQQLSDIETGIIEGAASAFSPTGLATNLFGVGLGVTKGLKRGWLSGLFHGVNDVTNGTFRSSIYDDELATLAEGAATDFLGALRAKGIDVSSLAPDGSFSAADAERVAGPAAGKAWTGIVNHANDLAQQRARFIMGDYGKVGPIEKMLGGPVPFASWVIRAYPVALALAAEHPIVALAMYQYYRATQKTKGDGSPDYTGGMLPIPTDTPYVGPLVAAMVPGNKGTVYVDPVGAISPVSNEMFSAGEDDPGATWYQKATKLLERTGLPGVNPAIQTGAYLTGLDYKGPGSQTNTQGIEDAAALIPGNAGLPNPMPGLLAAGRSAISPAIGPALGGQADPNASVYDPVTKRYAELWYEKTHLALSDPRNRIGLVGMADPDNPLMQQARREVLLAGAARNVNSLVDPVGATAQTDTARQVKAAQDQAALPSYGALAGLDPFIRAQVQQQIDAAKAANPLLTLHQGETPSARANMLILDWERQNQGLRNLWPGMYQLQLLAERERLGLERPGSVAQEYRTFDQRNAGTLPGGPMIMPGVPLPSDNRAGQAVRDLVRQRLSSGR